MATRKTRAEIERLDDAHMDRVISFLEPKEGKAGTKKEACAILGHRLQRNTARRAN